MNNLFRSITNYIDRVSTYEASVVAVELLLIGLMVWLAMRFLRGTRGASLLKGAAVVLVGVYLAVRLLPRERQWDRILFLYEKFLWVAFVAMIVAFQPELRRALTQIGRTRLFGGPRRYVEQEIGSLVESAGYLSRNKIGAIVAIERRVGLGAVVETGTPMDAELRATTLNTIFFPGTQLHDMAAVVRNGRISAAGCQLPLAESEDVDPSLGSRHRAALGLAQDTDAVIVVVSEETGRISVACEGQLYVGLDGEGLRSLLEATLAPNPRNWRERWRVARGRMPRP